MNNLEILKIAMAQSAEDISCSAEDFEKDENVIVFSKENEKARKYLTLPFSCQLVSYGKNIVASVAPSLKRLRANTSNALRFIIALKRRICTRFRKNSVRMA